MVVAQRCYCFLPLSISFFHPSDSKIGKWQGYSRRKIVFVGSLLVYLILVKEKVPFRRGVCPRKSGFTIQRRLQTRNVFIMQEVHRSGKTARSSFYWSQIAEPPPKLEVLFTMCLLRPSYLFSLFFDFFALIGSSYVHSGFSLGAISAFNLCLKLITHLKIQLYGLKFSNINIFFFLMNAISDHQRELPALSPLPLPLSILLKIFFFF